MKFVNNLQNYNLVTFIPMWGMPIPIWGITIPIRGTLIPIWGINVIICYNL